MHDKHLESIRRPLHKGFSWPERSLNCKPPNRLNTIRRMVEKKGPESQREVQRLLGRCLLRLQQNEQFLKSLIARSEISGAVHEIESRLAERAAEVEKLTPDTP